MDNQNKLPAVLQKQKAKRFQGESPQLQAGKSIYLIHRAGRLNTFIHSVSF